MKNILKNLHQRIIPPKHQQTLYNQIIDEQQPGTILRDFGVLLDFVREHAPLKVTNTNHLLPMNMLKVTVWKDVWRRIAIPGMIQFNTVILIFKRSLA